MRFSELTAAQTNKRSSAIDNYIVDVLRTADIDSASSLSQRLLHSCSLSQCTICYMLVEHADFETLEKLGAPRET